MSGDQYAFGYGPNTVYSQVVSLVADHHSQVEGGIHLDLGCGFGAIAEPIRELGLIYVGVDLGTAGPASLSGRGFEAHSVDLDSVETLKSALTDLVAGRTIASMSIIDTLEHVTRGPEVLEVLRAVSAESGNGCLVVSVPNVSHRDLATKLLLGRWDYTETGLLDRTHVVHHTDQLLTDWTQAAGWREVGARDFSMHQSDQHFPADSVALSDSTLLGSYLRALTDKTHTYADTNQLVRAYLPGAARGQAWRDRTPEQQPFLSVIMRTQGRRPETMQDALACLLGQTNQSFELIVLPHRVSYDVQVSVERMIDDFPEDLRRRSRVVPVDNGGRSRPLNVGLEHARGQYIAILDDDDLVLGHWVEAFAALAERGPGRVLRCVAVEQDIAEAALGAAGSWEGHRTVSAVRHRFSSEFDLYDHFTENHSPPVSLAFPRSVFRDLGVRFDESLNVLEDWDVLLRTALLCGVVSSPAITSVYRRWAVGEASHTLHHRDEWKGAENAIVQRLDTATNLFPPGTIGRIRQQRAAPAADNSAVHHWVKKLEGDVEELRLALLTSEREVEALRTSRSWRLTGAFRSSGRVLRKLTGRSETPTL